MFGPWNGGMLGMPGYGGLLNPEDQAFLRNQGMMSLAANLLAASGPSPVKQNFGSIAGKGLLGMQQGQQQTMQGLLQNKLYGAKLGEIEAEKKRQQGLLNLVGQKGEQIGATPYDDEGNPMMTPGTGLLGGKTSMPEFYAGVAGLGGDYTKQGITGLTSLQPNAANSPAAVREYEFFKKLGPEEQKQFLEIKRAFQPYTAIDYQGGKAAFDKRIGAVAPLSSAAQEATGQATVEGAKKSATTAAQAQTEAQFNLGSNLDDINKMRKEVKDLIGSKGFKTIYGASGTFDPRVYLPGTDAAGSEARRNQLEAESFGISIQKMRGFGQLSDAEGKKMTAAYTRAIDRRQPDDEAKKAWDEVLGFIDLAERRAKEKAGVTQPNPQGWSIRKK